MTLPFWMAISRPVRRSDRRAAARMRSTVTTISTSSNPSTVAWSANDGPWSPADP